MEVTDFNNIEEYFMDHKRRGICLIININNFSDGGKRTGSEEDVKNLTKTFKNLEFDVNIYSDLTARSIMEVIQKYASINHTDHDCFVCFLMSHGEKIRGSDYIIGSDMTTVELVKLIDPFKENITLKNKPKLFFVQACRVDNEMHRIIEKDSCVRFLKCQSSFNQDSFESVESDLPPKSPHLPKETDILICYSTVSGFPARRNTLYGSYFIEALCSVFNKHARKESLQDMVTIIINMVSITGEQVPAPETRLRKRVYFREKKMAIVTNNRKQLPWTYVSNNHNAKN